MEMYFSANNREEVIQIPVLPVLELVECETKDEEFETIKGTLLLIGFKGLRHFSFTSFFPNKDYSFSATKQKADFYIRFFTKWRDKHVPVRVIVIDKGKEILNMACRYTFNVGVRDKAGDVPYTLEVKEYVFAKTEVTNSESNTPKKRYTDRHNRVRKQIDKEKQRGHVRTGAKPNSSR